MKFQQKLKGREVEIELCDDYIRHSFQDTHEQVSFKVPYEQIDVEFPIGFTDKNIIWKFVAMPFFFLAIFAFGKMVVISETIEQSIAGAAVAAFWTLLALICLAVHRRSNVTFTMFSTSKGRMAVVHDGQQDAICEAIESRVLEVQKNADEEV